MRPAFSSRTKRRGTAPFATALREDFTTASDISHLHGCPTPTSSGLDRDYAANTGRHIEQDYRRWNGCAFPSSGSALDALAWKDLDCREADARPRQCRASASQMR